MGPHSFECGNTTFWSRDWRTWTSFNGAALVRVRKSQRARSQQCQRPRASMGPHSFECGNARPSFEPATLRDCFNGAALVRVRKWRWPPRGGRRARTSFNGAALVRVRKCIAGGQAVLWTAELQWGRTRSSAEMRAYKAAREREAWALQWGRTRSSAEIRSGSPATSARRPLQWGRTRSSAEMPEQWGPTKAAPSGFNGAALVRVRKSSRPASPHHPRPGGFNGAALVRVRKSAWVRSSAPAVAKRFNGAALVRVRKFAVRIRITWPLEDASMGPHSFECRNQACRAQECPKRVALQWGRTRSSAEICFGQMQALLLDHRFNGAALVRVRKFPMRASPGSKAIGASMGPHSFECGNVPCWSSWGRPRSRFNGAALVRVRKCPTCGGGDNGARGFNGAALVRVRK